MITIKYALFALGIAPMVLAAETTPSPVAPDWVTARVSDIQLLKTYPVQYAITYETHCGDSIARAIRVTTPEETVLGVAALREVGKACPELPPQYLTLHITGETTDASSVRALTANGP